MTTFRLRKERLQWLEADDEVVALDESALVYLNANSSGAVLWRALASGATREDLVGALLGEFEVAETTAGEDVDRFLADLEARGIIES